MITFLGVVFSMLSASSFGFNNVATRRTVLAASATLAVYASSIIGLPLFMVVALSSGEIFRAGEVSPLGYFWLAMSGIVHFILGRYCNYKSIAAIGSNRSQPISASNLLFTFALSMMFLGEQPQWRTVIGAALIMAGPLVSLRRHGAPVAVAAATPAAAPGREQPPVRLLEGYVFGLLAAACYGSSPALVKLGLAGANLPVWGATVSVGAALAVLLLSLLRPGQLGHVMGNVMWWGNRAEKQRWRNAPATWVFIGALTIAAAQLFRYLAIGAMDVTVSAPLISTVGVWSVLFSWLFNRHMETFSRSVLLGVALSVVGSIVLVAPIG
ncbi:MAG: EamA family transporter [Dehalococcoidia bacterium]|nr:EamA family transporter [Dehalococcoidia bacterium]